MEALIPETLHSPKDASHSFFASRVAFRLAIIGALALSETSVQADSGYSAQVRQTGDRLISQAHGSAPRGFKELRLVRGHPLFWFLQDPAPPPPGL